MTDRPRKDGVINIRVPVEVLDQLRHVSERDDTTVSEVIRSIVLDEIDRRSQPQDTAARVERALNAFAPFVILTREQDPDGRWTKQLQFAYNDLLDLLAEAKDQT